MAGRRLRRELLAWARRIRQSIEERRVLTNVNNASATSCPRRALLVYLTAPFRLSPGSETFNSHTNYWRNRELARLLGEFGYTVDVVNHSTPLARPDRSYDLVIGLGRAMLHLTDGLPDSTKSLYITTGTEGGFLNDRVAQRAAEVERERGRRIMFSRKNTEITRQLPRFDGLICLGNEATANTYRPHFNGPIYMFNNHGYDETAFLPENKDFEQARRHFLFFTGTQKLLNGLDLVLKVFAARPELNLHVYGTFRDEPDFVECFDQELNRTPNIHNGGWIAVGGDTYRQAVTTCSTMVVPICAGASHGSVVVCMNNGVIPIVSKEAGIDTADFGIMLDSCSVAAVTEAVDLVAAAPAHWHRKMANRTYEHARRDFSQAAFTTRLREIFRATILEQ